MNLPATNFSTAGNFVTSGGTINIAEGGSLNVGGETQIAQGVGVNSTLKIIDGNSVTANFWLAIGRGGGTGTVEMTGGTLAKVGGGNTFVGGRDGGASTGVFNQSGGTFNVNTELWIGQNANNADGPKSQGTFNLSGDAVVNLESWLAIGREGGVGTLNITGGTFNKQGGNHVEIGGTNGGTGLIAQNSGFFNVLTGETRMGLNNGVGTYSLSGNGVADLGLLSLGFDGNGSGTVNLNGGTLGATRIIKGSANGTAILNFNGGMLKAKADDVEAGSFLTALTIASVGAGGAIINSDGHVITFDQPLVSGVTGSADGGLAKNGEGTLRLSGANTYSGPTLLNTGTLALRASSTLGTGQITAAAGTTLRLRESVTIGGGAQVSGILDVLPEAAGAISVAKNLNFTAGSTARFTFGAAPALNSAVQVGGNIDLGGTTLSVAGTGTYEPGTKFTLFRYTGTLQGSFTNAADLSNVQIGGTNFQLQYNDNKAVTLTVAGGPTPTEYTDWASAAGLVSGNNGRDQDPDNDGRPNFLEFALDGSPLSSANDGKVVSRVAEVSPGVNALTITLPVRAGVTFSGGGDLVSTAVDGVTYTIQGSTDLIDFTTMDIIEVTPALSSGLPSLSSPGWTYRTFRAAGTPGPVTPRGFLRAQVVDSTIQAP